MRSPTFQIYDDTDDTCHGVFDTLDEARGAAAYDQLKNWTVYSNGQIVERRTADEVDCERLPTLQGVVDYLGAQAINGIGQFDAYWRTWYGNGFALAFNIKSKLR